LRIGVHEQHELDVAAGEEAVNVVVLVGVDALEISDLSPALVGRVPKGRQKRQRFEELRSAASGLELELETWLGL